jgi:trimeric autotransporter adhesin
MKIILLTFRHLGGKSPLLVLVLLHSFAALPARGQGTAFTYQGLLKSDSTEANGFFDFQFALHSASSGATQVGSTVSSNAVAVSNGRFTIMLDFGGNFPGADRWLEISVRTNGGGAFATLSPRQKISSTPHAIQSGNATTVSDGAITAAKLSVGVGANGQVLKMNGSVLGWGADNNNGGTVTGVTAGLGLAGGTITTSGTITIDTTLVPQLNAPNIFTTGPQNVRLTGGSNRGLVIRGGAGQTASLQEWENNGATTLAAVSANGTFTGNGAGLTNLSVPATNLTGTLPDAHLSANVPLLNGTNLFTGTNIFTGVATLTNAGNAFGGAFNGNGTGLTSLNPANLAAGTATINIAGNAATATTATNFSGPLAADVTGTQAATTVARIRGVNVSSAAPAANQHLRYDGANWAPAAVALGTDVSGTLAIANGGTGAGTASNALINLSGASLTASNTFSGVNRLTNVANSFSGSGASLTSLNASSLASGTVPDARLSANVALLNTSQTFAGNNTFSNVTLVSPASLTFGSTTRQMINLLNTNYAIGVQTNTLYQRSADGFAWFKNGVHSDAQTNAGTGGTLMMYLDASGNLRTTTGTISSLSDRNAKTNFALVNARQVLDRVAALPITTWNFKQADPSQRHIGPMAQDFRAAFGVGLDETSICTVDADGVALAAIQGLNQKLEDRSAKLEAENAKLKRRLEKVERLMNEKNGGAR